LSEQENQRGANGGAKDRQRRAQYGAKQKPASERDEHRAGHRKRHGHHIKQNIGAGSEQQIRRDKSSKRFPMTRKRIQ
jgi:hypothetical protein